MSLAESVRSMAGWYLHRTASEIRVRLPVPHPFLKATGDRQSLQNSAA